MRAYSFPNHSATSRSCLTFAFDSLYFTPPTIRMYYCIATQSQTEYIIIIIKIMRNIARDLCRASRAEVAVAAAAAVVLVNAMHRIMLDKERKKIPKKKVPRRLFGQETVECVTHVDAIEL